MTPSAQIMREPHGIARWCGRTWMLLVSVMAGLLYVALNQPDRTMRLILADDDDAR